MFHAGDGNLHPLILYDANKPGELERAEQFGADILRLCVEVGGVLTGEHGVGVEKRDLMPVMFSEIDLNQQQRSNAPSTTRACSIPARCFRPCIAAPSSAACTCMPGGWRSRIFRGFDARPTCGFSLNFRWMISLHSCKKVTDSPACDDPYLFG